MDLFEVPAIALLAVSDNSATGVPLLGRGDDLRKGVGDSGNRVLLTAVPVIVFAVALRLADRCIGGRDDRED